MVPLRDGGRLFFPLRCERFFPLFGPEHAGLFAMIALQLVGHPEQRAVDHGAVVACQVDDPGLDDEAAEFDQMSRALRRSTCQARMSCRARAARCRLRAARLRLSAARVAVRR